MIDKILSQISSCVMVFEETKAQHHLGHLHDTCVMYFRRVIPKRSWVIHRSAHLQIHTFINQAVSLVWMPVFGHKLWQVLYVSYCILISPKPVKNILLFLLQIRIVSEKLVDSSKVTGLGSNQDRIKSKIYLKFFN